MSESLPDNLFDAAYACLMCKTLSAKLTQTQQTAQFYLQADKLAALDFKQQQSSAAQAVIEIPMPGRPLQPPLVAPRDLVKRGLGTPEGRAALIHAITHIEFNAINLAWDAVFRFRDMPWEYYADWIRIADEEVQHFQLLATHLQSLGYQYGDFPAHNGLWEMAVETADEVMVRMALVPRVLEARGLDVTPGIMKKLYNIGDLRAVEILEVILTEEIGHVAAGTRWFRYACERQNLPPEATFAKLLKTRMKSRIKPPFHEQARREAGFTETEMSLLMQTGSSFG
ncbi:ferritin-like domain-containing protein [Candidatus Venteria ishoeyi]|uniref:Ferritin-like domain-containing protein n=1 Tax=Candidatus Venteria ishoeyi TaxID=1899563 RepID=A0A1H6FBU7_9GAMM|nr:ferritin-like domain-containing protein [Candidatus Venteria ishoeyi]SEH06616.1 Uncharacterised protein [Candidatus Venteria ishoeyi]